MYSIINNYTIKFPHYLTGRNVWEILGQMHMHYTTADTNVWYVFVIDSQLCFCLTDFHWADVRYFQFLENFESMKYIVMP